MAPNLNHVCGIEELGRNKVYGLGVIEVSIFECE
jgi:hypothetical protein